MRSRCVRAAVRLDDETGRDALSPPRVSVALATFNGARFLPDQFESLTAQKVRPFELIVCDDCSDDGSLDLVESFAEVAPFPVHVYRNDQRLGFANTFLRASSLCTGAAVAFCDQDDVWLPDKLARCANALACRDVLLVVHTSAIVDAGLRPVGKRFPDVRADRIDPPLSGDPWLAVRGMSMVAAASVVTLATAEERPPSHYLAGERMNHDEWIYTLARARGSVAYIAEPLALYRQHDANVTGDRGGFRERLGEVAAIGCTYYSRRLEQANQLVALFERLGYTDAAASYRALADRLRQRVRVYARGASRARRLAGIPHAVRGGVYASRRRGGFGFRGLARDVAMIALGRS